MQAGRSIDWGGAMNVKISSLSPIYPSIQCRCSSNSFFSFFSYLQYGTSKYLYYALRPKHK